jgi:ankyrin repeat protein
MLVEHGADATAPDRRKRTPLHLVSTGTCAEFACVLVDYGADVTACDEDGWTPLHVAAAWGRTEVARTIMRLGGDTKARDREGRTPSQLALDRRYLELALMLSKPTSLEKDGQTAFRR